MNISKYCYKIEAICDLDGDFPLECLILLLNILKIRSNVILKNQKTIRNEKNDVIKTYIEKYNAILYDFHNKNNCDYFIFLNHEYTNNEILMDFLQLQGVEQNFIAVNTSFNYNEFIANLDKNTDNLIYLNQASFACDILDLERMLVLKFNTKIYNDFKINKILEEWETKICEITNKYKMDKINYFSKIKNENIKVVELKIFQSEKNKQ